MDLSYPGQRAYCAALGLINPDADPLDSWYRDPVCQEVSRLLTAMETQAGKIEDARHWIASNMETVAGKFAAPEIHSVTVNSCGEVGRHALDYDMAVAAYWSLQDQLQQLVVRIRRDAGYQITSFSRLEEHPALSPEDDTAMRELAELRKHYLDYESWNDAGKRRHLVTEHRWTTNGARKCDDLGRAHDVEHEGRLAELLILKDRLALKHPGVSLPA
jgi:hypothetical protein